jgi:ADP-heptose:LPS heptosyltransferase
LQKEVPAADAALLAGRPDIRPIGPILGDFADTAAVVEQLDLLVTVDTSVPHVAGALGKPLWILLPHNPHDWRWLLEREDSLWYPHARLVRQPRPGDWASVVARAADMLERHFAAG